MKKTETVKKTAVNTQRYTPETAFVEKVETITPKKNGTVKILCTVTHFSTYGEFIAGKTYEVPEELAENHIKNGVATKC